MLTPATDHRPPMPCETRVFEVTGLVLPLGQRPFYVRKRWRMPEQQRSYLAYEKRPDRAGTRKGTIEQVRTLLPPK